MTPDQFPSLAALAAEIDTPPAPLSWWVRHDQLLAAVACLCIFAVTAYAIGEIAEVTAFFRSFAGV